jgi:hypothetical protein
MLQAELILVATRGVPSLGTAVYKLPVVADLKYW